jgi:hypothetical protein
VVAGHHEGRDPRRPEGAQPVDERELAADRPLLAVEDVAGDQHEVDVLGNRQRHDAAPRFEGGPLHRGRHVRGRGLGKSAEGAVEVQVGGMHKTEGALHLCLADCDPLRSAASFPPRSGPE